MDIELIGVDELTAILKDTLKEPGKLIVLDGVQGAGQKELGKRLAKELGCQHRSVDMEEIVPVVRADIQGALAKGSVIVDGVMMRTIIAAASVDVDVHVYVVPSQANKRRAFWEGILSKPLDAYLAELKDINDKQTVKYHWSTHPVVNADFIVEGA